MVKPDQDPLQDPRFSSLLQQMRESAPPAISDGFSDSVMAQIQHKSKRKRVRFAIVRKAAVAAIFLLAIGLCIQNFDHNKAQPSPVQILMTYQGVNGGWSSGVEKLHSRYDTGVTALALLALMRVEAGSHEEEHRMSIHAGMTHLLEQQNPAGYFEDSSSRMPFTSYLAGMALQLAVQQSDAPSEWHTAARQVAPYLPSSVQMATLNQQLSHPDTFPARWAEVGGPAAIAAIQALQQ